MKNDSPWSSWPTGAASTALTAWYKSRVDYRPDSNALQNLDIWLPQTEQPPAEGWPQRDGLWLIYVHGGAWRDPLVDSTSFNSPVNHILSNHKDKLAKIAGIASINYSLSPYPSHATHPAPVPGHGVDGIPDRSARHPDHIIDVLTAISFLDSKFAFGSKYVLAGHSCGATLAFQVLMDRSQWIDDRSDVSHIHKVPKPITVVGLNGLYDLPALIHQPGDRHKKLVAEYTEFTRLAFGNDEETWAAISPTSVQNWSQVWPEGQQAVLVQSHEDTLVPYSQTDLMFKNLRQRTSQLKISEMDATGDHNELWGQGDRLAEILVAVLNSSS